MVKVYSPKNLARIKAMSRVAIFAVNPESVVFFIEDAPDGKIVSDFSGLILALVANRGLN